MSGLDETLRQRLADQPASVPPTTDSSPEPGAAAATAQMIGDAGEFVLVRGVVYKRVRQYRRSGERVFWLRLSVPSDVAPGKRSKWPPRYNEHKLPAHEPVTPARAKEIQVASLAQLDKFRIPGGTP